MLPHLLGLNGEVAGSAVQVPPPPRFQALLPIHGAVFGDWTRTATGTSEAQKRGLRFEKRVHVALREALGYRYHEGQVIKYVDSRGPGACIPDGIIKDLGVLVAVEVKSQHMPESWWQLRKKYEPLLRYIFPGQRVLCLEICRSLDAAMPYPEAFEHVEDIATWLEKAPDGQLGVHQWKL